VLVQVWVWDCLQFDPAPCGFDGFASAEVHFGRLYISDALGSGLIDQIQKMTMAAMAIADMNVWAQRSYRV
jgi:hypothetical protein